jgi:hypothetical protein
VNPATMLGVPMLAAVTNLSRVSGAFADGLIGCTPSRA